MKEPKCPICALVVDSVERLFDTVLYELVNDPKVRSQLRNGICDKHTEQILDFLSKHPEQGILGISIIYEDILATRIEQLENDKMLAAKCSFCEYEKDVEELYLSSFQSVLSHVEGLELYEKSASILCLNHYFALSQLLPVETVGWLKSIQVKKMEKLKHQLTVVIGKHDYRNKEPIGLEAKAYAYASRIVTSIKKEFGRNPDEEFGKNRKKNRR